MMVRNIALALIFVDTFVFVLAAQPIATAKWLPEYGLEHEATSKVEDLFR